MVGSAGFLVGGLVAMRLARRLLPRHILRSAAALMVVGTIAPTIVLALGFTAWPVVIAALLPFYVGWGLAQPMATSIAMRPFPEMAGQASAWAGMAQQIGGIGFALAASALGGGMGTLAVMIVAAVAFTGTVFLPVQKPAA